VISKIAHPEVQQFIREHEHEDERDLVLKSKTLFDLPVGLIANQLSGRRKAKDKLPTFYSTSGIVYPPGLNLEQSSSEKTGLFKTVLLKELLSEKEFNSAVDMTGGFGVDSFYLSKLFKSVDYVDSALSILEIAKHNHAVLGSNNIVHHNDTAETFFDKIQSEVDLIFIDPSRRTEGKKVFTFSDSAPDVVGLLNQIFQKANYLLIKASPLLDIKQGLESLKSTKKVFVVAVDNEVREVLFFCERNFSGLTEIEAVNISKNTINDRFLFSFEEEIATASRIGMPKSYLYEPSAAILKAGAFKKISEKFSIDKINTSTHLYASDELLYDFPGRIFKIESFTKPDSKDLFKHFPEGKANIAIRNYPLTVEQLRKKTKLKDGGEKYLLGFSGVNEKFLVIASRLK
jgi:hypothetical protein